MVSNSGVIVTELESFSIVTADTPARISTARELLKEYGESIAGTACLTDFDEELAGLPGVYGPPGGALLLGYHGDEAIGCVCMRDLGDGVCEMKRLYVSPAHRTAGAGKALVEALVQSAREHHYRSMRLDTLPSMTRAIQLYRQLGFVGIEPYGPGAAANALFFERSLAT